jgi:spore coat protein A
MNHLIAFAAFAVVSVATPAHAAPLAVTLERYVDPLPVPPVLTAAPGAPLTVHLTQQRVKLHRDLPETDVWGYEGSSPGPTISVERGQSLEVHWTNALPATHVLARPEGVDMTLPDVRADTHLHCPAVLQTRRDDKELDSDGWPDLWTVAGETQRAIYPNDQAARLLWYHDHAMGTTGRNVAAGLIGAYEIHDDYERSLNLPSGAYEIPLLLQTKLLKDDGTLAYTGEIGKEFFGNATAVNGKLYPYLTVEPRKYRFRIVNTANARTYALKFLDGPAFNQIGSDAGFLEKTVAVPKLTLAPSERADVVVDFAAYAGKTLVLNNSGRDISDDELPVPDVLQVRVAAAATGPDTSSLPADMKPIERLDPATAAATRQVVFDQMDMGDGGTMLSLNHKMWMDPIEERPVLGTTEVWELVNPLIDIHPFHIHLVEFQVLDRRLFDAQEYLASGKVVYTGDPVPPGPGETGWKDTVRVMPQMITRIVMRFAPYAGYYVYHCHILEHEDLGMMGTVDVRA